MIRVEKVTYYNRDNEEAFSVIQLYLVLFGYIIWSRNYIDGEYTRDTYGVRLSVLKEW